MAGFYRVRIWRAVLTVAGFAVLAALACDVPVFRYALERWTPDRFVVVVFHRDPFTPQQRALVEALEKAGNTGSANLLVCRTDVTAAMPAAFQMLWKAQAGPSLPWMVVRYPARTGFEAPVWTGPLGAQSVADLVDSPARREIVRNLCRGDTAVWLLLASGDPPRDDALEHVLQTQSRILEHTIELPAPSSEDPPTTLDLPLKVAFSTVRVSRSNPAERFLVNQLLNWDAKLRSTTEAVLFPVFGQGRVLPPAVGPAIRPEVISAMAKMLTGPCSCQIKEMNAGFDLLLPARWGTLLERRPVSDRELPPLASIAGLAAVATNRPSAPSPQTRGVMASVPATPEPLGRDTLVRNLAIVLGGAAAFLAIATLIMKGKAGRAPH